MADEGSFNAGTIFRRLKEYMGDLESRCAQLEKKNADLEARVARQQGNRLDLDGESHVKRTIYACPTLVLDGQSKIIFANEAYTKLTGYELSEIRNTSVEGYIQGLQSLMQIHPALLALENLVCYLDHVPVTVCCKGEKSLVYAADINFGSSNGRGYDGAQLFLGQRRNGFGAMIAHLLHRHQHTLTLNAHEYAASREGILTYQTLETQSEPIYLQPLFNLSLTDA